MVACCVCRPPSFGVWVTCYPMWLVPQYSGCLPNQRVLWSDALGNFEYPKKGVAEPSNTHVTCFQSDMGMRR